MATHRDTLLRPTVGVGSGVRARSRPWLLAAVCVAVLLVSIAVGIAFGSVSIPPSDTLGIIAQRLFGLDLGRTWSDASQAIVWDLRVPRVLLAGVVGVALALAGATFQGLMRNPLADPYVLGTASGAALGAAIGVLLPVRAVVLGFGLVNGLAFLGALVAVWVVFRLARSSGLSPMTGLLLTGYAVGSLLAAALALAMFSSGAALRQIFGYLLGGFEGATWERLAGASLLVAIGGTLLMLRARSLNGLLLGEEAAAHLGVDVRRERGVLTALGSLVTAAAVAVSGLIGFVGLVVPHVVRLLVGPSARLVLPLSALVGASLLILADVVARALGDIPVGVVTAVIGAPFFLLLLRRARSGYEL